MYVVFTDCDDPNVITFKYKEAAIAEYERRLDSFDSAPSPFVYMGEVLSRTQVTKIKEQVDSNG